jgi:hypothetical protein
MTARSRTDRPPGAAARQRRTRPVTAGQDVLPWWAVVLPVLGFVLLLSLLLGGNEAGAAAHHPGADFLAGVWERLERLLLG